MPKSFILFRYDINSDYDEFMSTLDENAGKPFAYRTIVRNESDKDNIVTLPKLKTIDNQHNANVWSIARKLKEREVAKVIDDNKSIRQDSVPVIDEWQYTRFIAISNLNIIAVEDKNPPVGMRAQSAISRFKLYCKALDIRFSYQNISTNEDIKKALKDWNIHTFSFSLRPFNPHPTEKAKSFSDNLIENGVKKLAGKITAGNEGISKTDEGFIKIIMEFNDNNYGFISCKGETNLGHQASIKGGSISGDKERDIKKSEEKKVFRLTIDATDDAIIDNVGKAIVAISR